MANAFRLKTQPEILFTMLMQARAELDATGQGNVDLNTGSVWRTFLEICAESDADQYIQIGKLLKLFSIFTAKGNDLDLRMLDFGAEIFPEMKRLTASASIAQVTVGDGTLLQSSFFANDTAQFATSFAVETGGGASFPIAGSLIIEQGTVRQESIIYSRSGDTFTVLFPLTGLQNSHPQGAAVITDAVRSFLQSNISIGNTTIALPTGTGAAWSASGNVIIDQGTVVEEKLAFTRSGDTLTTAASSFAHSAGAYIVQSTFGSNRAIPTGQICLVPATLTTQEVDFRVTDTGASLLDGSFISGLVNVASLAVGASTKVGANTILKWQNAPFSGATVFNPGPATGGRDREEDGAYVARVVNVIQALSKATPLATTTLVSGATDPVTNVQVAFAQIIEPVAPGLSFLYISDGTPTFNLNQVIFSGRDVVISDAENGDRRGRLHNYGPFVVSTSPTSPRLFKSFQRGTATSTGANSLTDTSQSMATNFFAGAYLKTIDDLFYEITANNGTTFTLAASGATPALGDYSIVDFGTFPQISSTSTGTGSGTLTDSTQTMTTNAEANKWLTDSSGASYQIVSNTATQFTLNTTNTPASGAYTVTAGDPTPLVPGVDYTFNQTNGDIELASTEPCVAHDCLVAASDGSSPSVGGYTYTTGVGAYVQRLVNGDPTDFTDFPGIRADGTQVLVIAPVTISTNFAIQVIPSTGFSVADVTDDVVNAVANYVNSLGIGQNVILSQIIAAIVAVPGVSDTTIITPPSNVTVPAGSIMRIDDDNVSVS